MDAHISDLDANGEQKPVIPEVGPRLCGQEWNKDSGAGSKLNLWVTIPSPAQRGQSIYAPACQNETQRNARDPRPEKGGNVRKCNGIFWGGKGDVPIVRSDVGRWWAHQQGTSHKTSLHFHENPI